MFEGKPRQDEVEELSKITRAIHTQWNIRLCGFHSPAAPLRPRLDKTERS
jgi:hypothetical protein